MSDSQFQSYQAQQPRYNDLYQNYQSHPPQYGEDMNNGNMNNGYEASESDVGGSSIASSIVKRKGRKGKIIGASCCIFLFLALAAILGVLFVIPRTVTFDMLPIAVENSTIDATPEGFTLPVKPIVSSRNDNFFNIYLDKVRVDGFHPAYSGGSQSLGTGGVDGVVLKKRETTLFGFPFVVHFNRTYDPELAYFSELLTNCSSTTNSNLFFFVDISVDYHMWAKGDILRQRKEIVAPCPISTEEAIRIQSLIGAAT